MSTVNMVALELKMAVSDDIRAASMTAMRSPLRPFGINSLTSRINATLVQPYSDWQTSLQSCGEAQATWSGNRALEAMPEVKGVYGVTVKSIRYLAAFAWKYHHPHWQEFKVPCQDAASFGVNHVLGGQCVLDNHLIRAPIPAY